MVYKKILMDANDFIDLLDQLKSLTTKIHDKPEFINAELKMAPHVLPPFSTFATTSDNDALLRAADRIKQDKAFNADSLLHDSRLFSYIDHAVNQDDVYLWDMLTYEKMIPHLTAGEINQLEDILNECTTISGLMLANDALYDEVARVLGEDNVRDLLYRLDYAMAGMGWLLSPDNNPKLNPQIMIMNRFIETNMQRLSELRCLLDENDEWIEANAGAAIGEDALSRINALLNFRALSAAVSKKDGEGYLHIGRAESELLYLQSDLGQIQQAIWVASSNNKAEPFHQELGNSIDAFRDSLLNDTAMTITASTEGLRVGYDLAHTASQN